MLICLCNQSGVKASWCETLLSSNRLVSSQRVFVCYHKVYWKWEHANSRSSPYRLHRKFYTSWQCVSFFSVESWNRFNSQWCRNEETNTKTIKLKTTWKTVLSSPSPLHQLQPCPFTPLRSNWTGITFQFVKRLPWWKWNAMRCNGELQMPRLHLIYKKAIHCSFSPKKIQEHFCFLVWHNVLWQMNNIAVFYFTFVSSATAFYSAH